MCFVQGFPGPTWLRRKLLEILKSCKGGGRRGTLPAQPFSHWALPASPSACFALQPAAVTCLVTQCLRPGGRPHPSTSTLSNPRAKGHPQATSWAAHPRTPAPGGATQVALTFRWCLEIYSSSPVGGPCFPS